MKKIVLTTLLGATLLVGGCGSGTQDKDVHLSPQKQETVYSEETHKLADAIEKEEKRNISKKTIKDLDKAVKQYEDKTKNLKDIDTQIGDYTLRTAKTIVALGNRQLELEQFKKEYPDKKESYTVAQFDVTINAIYTLNSINMKFEDVDVKLKNEYLGKKGNEVVTDILAQFTDVDADTVETAMGKTVLTNNEELNKEQIKVLSHTDYRKTMTDLMIKEEPSVSKHEYNATVDDFNNLAPEYLHYAKATKLVSPDENNKMMGIRNGIVGANTDLKAEVYESSSDDSEAFDDEDEYSDTEEPADESEEDVSDDSDSSKDESEDEISEEDTKEDSENKVDTESDTSDEDTDSDSVEE